MIVGVEGIHSWNGDIVLNDLASWPHYKLRRIRGLYSLGDFSPTPDPATQRLGEVPPEEERAGKTLVYEGDVRAKSLADLRTAIADLTAAFAPTGELEMVASPHGSYTGGDLEVRTFRARCLECPVEEEQAASPHRASHGYERPFTITLRLSDPRYYFDTPVSDSDDTLEAEGGTSFPFTPGDQLEPPSTQGISFTTTNAGNADVDAQLTLEGPCRNPIISNETTGHFLRFRDLEIEAAETVVVDFRARSIRRDDGANVRSKLDPASTWWDRGVSCLEPGDNLLKMRAYTISAGASLQADYYPADYS